MTRFSLFGMLILISLSILLLLVGRGNRDDQTTSRSVTERYLVCSNCGGDYDVPMDHAANLAPADMVRDHDDLFVRCDHCGEIAAQYGMVVKTGDDAEVVGVPRND